MSPLADALTPHGVDVLRFKFRGTWGIAGTLTVSHAIADLRAAVDVVTGPDAQARYGLWPSRIHVLGHSFGAAIGLLGAMDDDRITGVASVAAVDVGLDAIEYLDAAFDRQAWLDEAARYSRDTGFTHQNPAVHLDDVIAGYERFAVVPRASELLERRLLLVMALDDAGCPPELHVLPLYRVLRRLDQPRLEAEVLTTDHVLTGRWQNVFARVAEWVAAGRRAADAERP